MNIVQKLFSRERGSKRSIITFPDLSHKTIPRVNFVRPLKHEAAEVLVEGEAKEITCLAFSPSGAFLVSGSYFLTLWDMHTPKKGTIFQETPTPITQVSVMKDERMIMFSLSNGEVCVADIDNNYRQIGITRLDSHLRAVTGFSRDNDNCNLVYSCAKDGFIKRFDIRARNSTGLLKCFRFDTSPARSIELNGISQNPNKPQSISACGNDAYIRVYDLRRVTESATCLNDVYLPHDLVERRTACIKGIAYSNIGQLLACCNNQKIYMFQQEMGLGPEPIYPPFHLNEAEVYQGHTVSHQIDKHDITFFGPEDEYIASGSACGRIFFWNTGEPNKVSHIESDSHPVRCMTRHPDPQCSVMATCGNDELVHLWAPKLLTG